MLLLLTAGILYLAVALLTAIGVARVAAGDDRVLQRQEAALRERRLARRGAGTHKPDPAHRPADRGSTREAPVHAV
jgi:hypothetical protein